MLGTMRQGIVMKQAKTIWFAFEIAGVPFDPNTISDPAERELVSSIVESVSERIGRLHCPQHQEGPRILFRGIDLEHLEMEVLGCCESFLAQITAKMSESTS